MINCTTPHTGGAAKRPNPYITSNRCSKYKENYSSLVLSCCETGFKKNARNTRVAWIRGLCEVIYYYSMLVFLREFPQRRSYWFCVNVRNRSLFIMKRGSGTLVGFFCSKGMMYVFILLRRILDFIGVVFAVDCFGV